MGVVESAQSVECRGLRARAAGHGPWAAGHGPRVAACTVRWSPIVHEEQNERNENTNAIESGGRKDGIGSSCFGQIGRGLEKDLAVAGLGLGRGRGRGTGTTVIG